MERVEGWCFGRAVSGMWRMRWCQSVCPQLLTAVIAGGNVRGHLCIEWRPLSGRRGAEATPIPNATSRCRATVIAGAGDRCMAHCVCLSAPCSRSLGGLRDRICSRSRPGSVGAVCYDRRCGRVPHRWVKGHGGCGWGIALAVRNGFALPGAAGGSPGAGY